jgi:hypothetical protein
MIKKQIDISYEIENLKQIRRFRGLTRKRVLKYIRENCLKNTTTNIYLVNLIRRKARNNWMADLSDKQLIEYLELIEKGVIEP